MKRVSFETAKAIKEASYPQKACRYQYNYEGILVDLVREGGICYGPIAPTYLEVWLWLWREKKIPIDLCSVDNERWAYFEQGINISRDGYIYCDPEEAIIAAIDYLIANKLLK